MKKFIEKSLSILLILTLVVGVTPLSFAKKAEDNVNASLSNYSFDAPSGTLGEAFSEAIENESDVYNANSILSLHIKDGNAMVEFQSAINAILVVAIYTEEGKLIQTVEKSVGATDALAVESLALDTRIIPKYFVAKAFLLDVIDKFALCEEHVSIEYTETFEEFMDKTIEDFPSNIVLNYDNSIDNNFSVVKDNAKKITETTENILTYVDKQNCTYKFDNINEEIFALSPGDVLCFCDGVNVGESIVIKIASIIIDGESAEIIADSTADIDELYEYIKIDFSVEPSEESQIVDTSNLGDGVTYLGKTEALLETAGNDFVVDAPLSGTASDNFELSGKIKDGIELSGNISVSITASGRLYYDPDVKVEDLWWIFKKISYEHYILIECKLTPNISGTVGVSGKAEGDIPIAPLKIVTPAGVTIGIDVSVVVSASAGVELEIIKISRDIGFRYENTSGYTNLTTDPVTDVLPKLSAKVEGSLGIELKPNITFLEVIEANISAEVGGKIEAEKNFYDSDKSVKHACLVCFDGELKAYAKASIGAEAFGKPIECDLGPELTLTLFNFYWSLDYGEFEINKSCPHKAYEVKFTVKDDSGKPVSGAIVDSGADSSNAKFNADKYSVTTDSSGKASYYYLQGTYSATASAEDHESGSVQFRIIDFARDEEIVLKYTGEEEKPDNPGGTVGDISWNYNASSKTLTISGSGNMPDYATLTSAPWHQHYEEAGKIVVESGITGIGNYAFAQFRNVSEIELPETLTKIGMGSFYGCNYIQSIRIGDNVKSIGDYAFFACQSAKSIYIGSSVETIGKYAFAQCQAVSAITVPASVNSVGESAFKHCTNMDSITFMNNSCEIGNTEDTIFYGATIYGGGNSTAEDYASTYSRTFVIISTAKEADVETNAADLSTQSLDERYYAKTSGAYEGEEYVLVVVKKSANDIVLDNDSLLYIDQKTAETNGEIVFDFIPRTNDECVAYIIGKFSGGTQAKAEYQPADKPVQLIINTLPSKTAYIYKENNIVLNGIVVTAVYYDGSTEVIPEEKINVEVFDTSSVGSNSVTISYNGTTADYEINVSYAWWQWVIRILLLGFIWY